ncbi:hypothetical protein ACI2KR_26990 [Pseudomonas luteola]
MISDSRLAMAEQLFSTFNFECIIHDSQPGWQIESENQVSKICYGELDHDDGMKSANLIFHVVFEAGTDKVSDAYALDMESGAEVVSHPG